jgi:solute:Na+ symporter, SSS family
MVTLGMEALDWAVLCGYFVLLVATGVWFARRKTRNTDDYFLGGRSMPAWAVAISIVATSMSAASFIGVPEASYNGNLTYLATNIGMVLASIIIAVVFIPAFYRGRVGTIYELLGTRFGPGAATGASVAFLTGRIMASGARIYIGAIPAAIVLFGPARGLEPGNLLVAIGVLATIGILYTLAGGVASVIWSDVVQMGVLLGACVFAVFILAGHITVPIGEVVQALRTDTGGSKLKLLDPAMGSGGFDLASPFTLPACIIGFTLMGIGSYGTDHDLVQRMLTCKDSRRGSWSVIVGILVGIPSVALFLLVGLLLWVFYNRPEMTDIVTVTPIDSRRVFLTFILDYMPAGLSGLMMAGLFAAGLSSLNSAINAMSASFVNDVYKRFQPEKSERHYLRVGRIGVAGWGVVLAGFAAFCVFWQQQDGQFSEGSGLLTFALRVMTFAYAGLIAVFLTALLTKRGTTASVIAALIVGFVLVLSMESLLWGQFVDLEAMQARAGESRPLLLSVLGMAFVWKLTIATGGAFVVAAFPSGKRSGRTST